MKGREMKGILFKPDMIKAIAEGRKTQTRRLDGLKEINKEPNAWTYHPGCSFPKLGRFTFWFDNQKPYHGETGVTVCKPRYRIGEVVYIKEAWATYIQDDSLKPSQIPEHYRIWYKTDDSGELSKYRGKWRSPLFMPEWAARYFIKLLDVRPESWSHNDWVWRIEFQRITHPGK